MNFDAKPVKVMANGKQYRKHSLDINFENNFLNW